MAYDDALFQLGMDLTRSSTAQKEDLFETTPAASKLGTGITIENDADRSSGHRFTVDLFGARHLGDASRLGKILARCMTDIGAEIVSLGLDRKKSGDSLSGTAVLDEGYLAIHVFPNSRYAAFDISGCPSIAASSLLLALAEAFGAAEAVIGKCRRHHPANLASRNRPASATMAPRKARAHTRMTGTKAA